LYGKYRKNKVEQEMIKKRIENEIKIKIEDIKTSIKDIKEK
jgi:hypothetical protein